MAAITIEDYRAYLNPKTDLGEYGTPGQISVKKWVERGHWKGINENRAETIEHCCAKCSRLEMPKRNPEATAEACGCPVNFEGLKYCFRHAFAKRLCRRCGALLPTPQPKRKNQPHR